MATKMERNEEEIEAGVEEEEAGVVEVGVETEVGEEETGMEGGAEVEEEEGAGAEEEEGAGVEQEIIRLSTKVRTGVKEEETRVERDEIAGADMKGNGLETLIQ